MTSGMWLEALSELGVPRLGILEEVKIVCVYYPSMFTNTKISSYLNQDRDIMRMDLCEDYFMVWMVARPF